MAGAPVRVTLRAADSLLVELSGELDEDTARRVEETLTSELGRRGSAVRSVLFLLEAVTEFSVEARMAMVRVQEELLRRSLRSAWVTSQTRQRGQASWVIHYTGDRNARALPSLAEADAWLSGTRSATPTPPTRAPAAARAESPAPGQAEQRNTARLTRIDKLLDDARNGLKSLK